VISSGTAFWQSILERASRCLESALSKYVFEARATALSSGFRDDKSSADIAKRALRTTSDENAIRGMSKSQTRSQGRGMDLMGDDCEQVVWLKGDDLVFILFVQLNGIIGCSRGVWELEKTFEAVTSNPLQET